MQGRLEEIFDVGKKNKEKKKKKTGG